MATVKKAQFGLLAKAAGRAVEKYSEDQRDLKVVV